MMMMTTTIAALALCVAGEDLPCTSPWTARCDWRASTFRTSAQHEAAIDVDDADRITMVWSSRRQQDGRSGVYLQQFDRDGVAVGQEQCVNIFAQSHEIAPAIDSASGITWIAWQSHGRDGDGASIMARRFERDSSGKLVGGDEIVVNQNWLGDQCNPSIAVAHDGSAMIAWTTSEGWNGLPQAHARVFDAVGGGLTDEFLVSGRLNEMISSPCIEFGGGANSPCVTFGGGESGGGEWAIVYGKTDRVDHSPSGLAMCRFDLCGEPLGDEIDLTNVVTKFAVEPVIAAGKQGYLLTWCSPNDVESTNYSVLTVALSPAGQPMGAARVVHAASDVHRNGPAIAVNGDGYVIAWNDAGAESGADVLARRLQADGSPLGEPFAMTKAIKGSQTLRAAAATHRLLTNSHGELLCAWNGDANLGDGTAVHVSMVAREAWRVVDGSRGVKAARQVDAETDAIVGEIVAKPHEPPVFDRRTIDKGQREVREGVNEIGFVGILNSGWTPPDPHLAVGPNHLVAIANGEIAFFDKAGAVLFQDEIEGLAGFWGSLGATNFVFDPEVLYDPLPEGGGRFWAMASETVSAQSKSFILLAVSDDSDPNGTWHKYRIETTALAGTTFDSPNFGVDELLVYVTGDRSGTSNVYPVYVFSKFVMMAGNPATIVQSLLMPTSTQSAGIPPVNFDGSGPLYLIEHGESPTNTSVRLIAMTNQIEGPTFTAMQLTVPSYTAPEDPPQMGTTVRPETFDARFWSEAYRNGSLWATHHVGSSRVLVRWYEIAMNGWPTSGQQPVLVQSGTIDPGATVRTFFSAITADDQNNAALVFASSSPTSFISMQTAYRYASDPLGTFQAPITRQTNTAAYTTNRWGDYAGINVDPVDGLTMWAHHEYAIGTSWRTWIQSFYPGNPCPPDIDADGDVDVDDLLAVINAWGLCIGCDADVVPPQGNNMVDVDDLLLVINAWGGCN
jgi:hypothetical protein